MDPDGTRPGKPLLRPSVRLGESVRNRARCRYKTASPSTSFGRFWHLGCAGSHNPHSTDPSSRPPTVQVARDMQPRDLPGRKGVAVPFPYQPWVLEQPCLPPRVESRPLRGCLPTSHGATGVLPSRTSLRESLLYGE